MNKHLLWIISLLLIDFNLCYSKAGDEIVNDPIFNNENIGRMLFDVDISGKIFDKNGSLFTDEATITIRLHIAEKWVESPGCPPDLISREEVIEQKVTGGHFSWEGKATEISAEVSKEGFHGDVVHFSIGQQPTKRNDILFHLIPKGIPSKLEYTEGAQIPNKEDKRSGGKDCGWSFKKLWYFPIGEEETVWMTMSLDDKGNYVYTMKEPGGFILFPGYPKSESKPDELTSDLVWMTEAPESGYAQTITPHKDRIDNKIVSSPPCYYFRTPEGKYGKIQIEAGFRYYLQPDGSRNLEAGEEVVKKYPVNPIEANRHKGY